MSSQEVQSLPGVPVNDDDNGHDNDGDDDDHDDDDDTDDDDHDDDEHNDDDHHDDDDTDDEDHLGKECTLNLLCSRHRGNEEGLGSSPTLNPGFFYHDVDEHEHL